MTLQGRRIVVLGGSSGIGLAVAQAAVREGAAVVIASSRRARVDEALKTLPEGTEGHALDLADEPAVRAVFDRLGNFDHLVFTAGESLQLDRLTNTDIEAAKRFFGLRYWGAYLASKIRQRQHSRRRLDCLYLRHRRAAAAPGLVGGGQHLRRDGGLTRALAVELAPIRVNMVSPGVVKTPLWAGTAEADREALYRQSAERLPVGHVGEAAEIAEAYLYLMRQSYVTGQVLVVDGGGVLT